MSSSPCYKFPLHHYSDYDTVEKEDKVVEPGTVILTCKPFAYSLSPKFVDIRCDACFKLEAKSGGPSGLILQTCGGCQQVRYCNRECQRKGWGDGHKYECKGFSVHKRVAGSFARLLLRIIVKLQKNPDCYDEVGRRKVRRKFKDLVSHYADLRENAQRMEQVETMFQVVKSMLSHHPEIKVPNDAELLGICGRIFVNTFSITDFENHTLGTGLYLAGSIFDHSCDPIAVPSFDSTEITIRIIKEIPITYPIHKITICYRDVLPTDVRRESLRKGYYFECMCERCTNRVHDYAMHSVICKNNNCGNEVNPRVDKECSKCGNVLDEDFVKKVADTEEAAQARLDEMGDSAYLDVAEAYLRIMNNLNFSETHWLTTEMNLVAFDGCVDIQRWEKAYEYGLVALKGYQRYLFDLNPAMGLLLLKLAKLAWYLEKEKEARSYVLEAKKILDITHGPSSAFARQHLFPLIREIHLCSKLDELKTR